MSKSDTPSFNTQGALLGFIGTWIFGVLALIFSALRFEAGIYTALIMVSGATGILSSYVLQALTKKNNGVGFHPSLLVINALLTSIACYWLLSLLIW